MHMPKYLEIVKIVVLCCLWYSSSTSSNIIGKTLLTDFPYPVTLTMVQLVSVSVYCGPLLKIYDVKSVTLDRRIFWTLIIPLSLGKFMSSTMSHMSILKVPLSYAHTVKATLPFFTVILSRILLGEKHTTAVYLSLLPIIGGVILSTATEMSFDMIGLCSAISATFLFTLQNIFSKQCMKKTGMHHFYLLMILARIAAVCFVPIWLIIDARVFMHDSSSLQNTSAVKLTTLLVFAGLFNFLQHVFAFSILAIVSPLTYSVANSTKRIVIITSSLILLGNPVSTYNMMGMSMAIIGVLYYNKVKYDEHEAAKRAAILPHSHSGVNLLLTSVNGDWPRNGYTHQLVNGHTNQLSNGYTKAAYQESDSTATISVAQSSYKTKHRVPFAV